MVYSFWCQPVNRKANTKHIYPGGEWDRVKCLAYRSFEEWIEAGATTKPIEYIWLGPGLLYSVQYFSSVVVFFYSSFHSIFIWFDAWHYDVDDTSIDSLRPIRAFALMQIIILLAYSIWFSFIFSFFFLSFTLSTVGSISTRYKKNLCYAKKSSPNEPFVCVYITVLFFLIFFSFCFFCIHLFSSEIAANIFHVYCQKL